MAASSGRVVTSGKAVVASGRVVAIGRAVARHCLARERERSRSPARRHLALCWRYRLFFFELFFSLLFLVVGVVVPSRFIYCVATHPWS